MEPKENEIEDIYNFEIRLPVIPDGSEARLEAHLIPN